MNLDQAAERFRAFAGVIKALRTPGTGCPWDLEQDHQSLRPFLIEEAYEVLDALDRGDDAALREELGDLLLQVVLHAQIADDRGAFSITEVIDGIERKMVRRHPHVFGQTVVADSGEVLKNWHEIKEAESAAKGQDPSPAASMARLPLNLPALQRAQRIGEKAAKAGLAELDLAIVDKRIAELKEAAERGAVNTALGALLFDVCQLARAHGISAEDCLRERNKCFIDNFKEPRTK